MGKLLVEVIAILAIAIVVLVTVQSCTGRRDYRSIREETLEGNVGSEENSDRPAQSVIR